MLNGSPWWFICEIRLLSAAIEASGLCVAFCEAQTLSVAPKASLVVLLSIIVRSFPRHPSSGGRQILSTLIDLIRNLSSKNSISSPSLISSKQYKSLPKMLSTFFSSSAVEPVEGIKCQAKSKAEYDDWRWWFHQPSISEALGRSVLLASPSGNVPDWLVDSATILEFESSVDFKGLRAWFSPWKSEVVSALSTCVVKWCL